MAPAPPPPDRASLGRAVAALYTSHDPAERLAADEWLQNFLRSDHAWPLSIELLRDATDLTSLEALFCARALHVLLRKSVVKATRTQQSHAVLGENDWVAMRDALLALAWSFSVKVFVGSAGGQVEAPPRAVLTQVSLAISALACKMDAWDAGSVVADLLARFGRADGGDASSPTTNAPSAARALAARHPLVSSAVDPRFPGAVVLDAVGERLLVAAGEACVVSVLEVLPEEAASKDLSIHPRRRAAIVDGLRGAAAALVFPALDALATKAFESSNGGADTDHHARAAALRAAAAWASFDENIEPGACPGAALDRAVAVLSVFENAADDPHHLVVDAAVTLATAALSGAVHRTGARRQALAEKLGVLRASAAEGGPLSALDGVRERRARAAEVLASVACRAALPPAARPEHAPADAFGTGPNAAAGRTYVPHKEFSKLRKAKKRSDKRDDRRAAADGSKPPPLAGADAEVLCFCLDALCDAMAGDAPGASPAAALQPWTEIAAAFESHRACGGRVGPPADELVACARRVAAAAAAAAPRWFPKDGASAANDGDTERAFLSDDELDDDDQSSCAARREDLAEGLRDVATVVGPDAFLAIAVEGFAGSAESGSVPAVEGWTFVLFACGRLVTKQHASQSRDVANVTRLAVRVAAAVIRANASPRAVELCAWILGGLAKSVSGCVASSNLRTGEADDATQILSEAFDGVLCASRSNSPSVTRGACVAAMRLAETNAAAVASERFEAARAALLDAYRSGNLASPPPHALRRGQEPVSTILARGLAAIAAAREPASEADAAAASLATPAAAAAARAAEALRLACQAASSAPPSSAALDLAATESVHAGLALYVALVETNVTVEASLAASRRALAALAPGDEDSLAGKRALRDAVFPAVASAVEAARLARPVFASCGFGTDASESGSGTRVRLKSIGSLRGTSDILAAAAALVRAVAKSSPDVETFADAARLAARAYAADPERHYHFLAVCVDACVATTPDAASDDASTSHPTTRRRHIETIDAMRGVASELSLAVLRVAFQPDNNQARNPRIPARAEARVAAYAAAQAAIRAGCASLCAPSGTHSTQGTGTHASVPSVSNVPFFAVLAHVSLLSLRSETSGEEALAALALAADVAGAASALAPARFAPGRVDEHARAAAAVHPGMGRLASAMRGGGASRGSNLPEWAAGMERSRALAETAAETLAGGDVVAFDSSSRRAVGEKFDGVSVFEEDAGRSFGARLLRAMLRCACGSMPPGMVTDISAALFATWAACGDRVFGTWLAEALGGDRDGFPRKSTTLDQKASFVNELLGTFGDAGDAGDAGDRTSPREASPEAKMDLRRFKRCVKAFCGGKKVGK
jgi:hypothetical protein